MHLSPDNFLTQIKNLVTGGGLGYFSTGVLANGGYYHDTQILLQPTVTSTTIVNVATSTGSSTAFGIAVNVFSGAYVNGIFQVSTSAGSTIGSTSFMIPRDYDEESDVSALRILVAKAGAGSLLPALTFAGDTLALGASTKVAITGSTGTLLTSTAITQIQDFNFSGQGLKRDSLVTMAIGSNGAVSTAGQDLEILGVEFTYASDLVSFSTINAKGDSIR